MTDVGIMGVPSRSAQAGRHLSLRSLCFFFGKNHEAEEAKAPKPLTSFLWWNPSTQHQICSMSKVSPVASVNKRLLMELLIYHHQINGINQVEMGGAEDGVSYMPTHCCMVKPFIITSNMQHFNGAVISQHLYETEDEVDYSLFPPILNK